MGQPVSSRPVITDSTGVLVVVQANIGGRTKTVQISKDNLLAGIGGGGVKLVNRTGDFNQTVAADTMVTNFFVTIASGAPTIRIGTTDMGIDILGDTLITGNQPIPNLTYFPSSGAVYFYVTGGNVNVRIDLTNNYK